MQCLFHFQLKEEMLSAYQQLKALCLQLHRKQGSSNNTTNNNKSSLVADLSEASSADFVQNLHHLPLGHLNDIVLELKSLIMNGSNSCPFCHTSDKVPEMTLALKQKDLEIKKRDEEIASLQSQVRNLEKKSKRSWQDLTVHIVQSFLSTPIYILHVNAQTWASQFRIFIIESYQ